MGYLVIRSRFLVVGLQVLEGTSSSHVVARTILVESADSEK